MPNANASGSKPASVSPPSIAIAPAMPNVLATATTGTIFSGFRWNAGLWWYTGTCTCGGVVGPKENTVSEWLLIHTKWANFQLYDGKNMIHSMKWCGPLCTNKLSLIFINYSSLKQESAGRYVDLLGHIVLILSQPVFALDP